MPAPILHRDLWPTVGHLVHTIATRGIDVDPTDLLVYRSVIGGAIRPRLPGKLFRDVHGQTSRALNPEAGLNTILYSDWL